MKFPSALAATVLLCGYAAVAVPVSGTVIEALGGPGIENARVTLFSADLQYFREARTRSDGTFEFQYVGSGTYRLGVAAINYDYQERALIVDALSVTNLFSLSRETNGGRWSIVGNTDPELLDGSGSGTLLPSGEIFFCHDTQEPIMFEPVTAAKWYPPNSGSAQGCHTTTLNTDGGMFLVGGSMGGNPQDPVVKLAKSYNRSLNIWTTNADMFVGRWYPGLVRLADERLLVLGGELNGPAGRTNGCEIYDSRSNRWSITGSFNLPTEIPPAVLLLNGEVLKTWRTPELYNPITGVWRAAAAMQQARTGASFGDHADHEIVHLPDGRVMAVGIFPLATNANTRYCEFYHPASNTWTLGPNPRALRNRPEALILPDGRVLSFGGQYSGTNPAPVALTNAGTIPNCTKVADLYDPALNLWRPVADLNRSIHYHNVTLLAPDGRVIATGGAGVTSARSFAGDDSSIEAFEPPYLFRGVRPMIDSLSTADLSPGTNFSLHVSLTERITSLVLVSARAVTHWVDGGPQRFLNLDFVQNGSEVQASVPNDPVRALSGYYILFAMVDDIPSVGRIVRMAPATMARPGFPTVSIVATDSVASEAPPNSAAFTVSRTGTTTAPLVVQLAFSGTAIDGADFIHSTAFTLPAGFTSISFAIAPTNDTLSEGTESVIVSLVPTSAYNPGASTNVTLSILDNDSAPEPFRLVLKPLGTNFELTVNGPATRLVQTEFGDGIETFAPLAPLLNATGSVTLVEPLSTNGMQLFRAWMRQ
jgi:galactose oxidase-like protein/carboxypeptidase family protein